MLKRMLSLLRRPPKPSAPEGAEVQAAKSSEQTRGGRARSERAERRQVAALPWRRTEAGLQVLLISSRETRRWVIPKGGRMAGKTDGEAAAQEALEEAGIEGATVRDPIGTFRYAKTLKSGAARWCVVSVYPLEVTVEHDDWQEREERERAWVSREEAVRRVDEPDLKAMIAGFEP